MPKRWRCTSAPPAIASAPPSSPRRPRRAPPTRSPSIARRACTRFALELRPAEHASAHRLRVSLGDALANAGRGPEAARAYLAATAKAGAAERLDLLRRAATQFLFSGHFPEGIETLGTVLAAVGMRLPETPRAALATLLVGRARVRLRGLAYRERDPSQIPPDQLTRIDVADAATTGLGMVDSLRAAAFQARHFLWAMEAGEPWRVSRAYAAEACFVSMAGARAAARTQRTIEELAAVSARLDRVEADAILAGVRGIAEFQDGPLARLARPLRRGRAAPARALHRLHLGAHDGADLHVLLPRAPRRAAHRLAADARARQGGAASAATSIF